MRASTASGKEKRKEKGKGGKKKKESGKGGGARALLVYYLTLN
jgi:hypothetical protein